jgi:hypothetical protein
MTITASDYIVMSMLRLQEKVMANINPPPPLEEKKAGLRATTTISKALIIEEVKEDSDQEDDIAKRMKELNVVDDSKNNAF